MPEISSNPFSFSALPAVFQLSNAQSIHFGVTTCHQPSGYLPTMFNLERGQACSYHVRELAINSLLGRSPGQGAMYVSFFLECMQNVRSQVKLQAGPQVGFVVLVYLWMSTSVTWMNPATLLHRISI